MALLPIRDIWGIGSRLAARLKLMNIHTALDLKNAHSPTLRTEYSVVMARLIAELNGESCIELESMTPAKQTIASTRSFGIPVTELAALRESITFHVSQAAERARRQNTYANSLTVFIQTSPFGPLPYYANSQTVALPSPSNDSRLLAKTANWMLKRLFKPDYVYQKSGVMLNDLVPAAECSTGFIFRQISGSAQSMQTEKLMAVLDEVNRRYGRQTLKLGSEGVKSPWKMKQNLKTPNYTCDWNGLIQAY